MALAVALHNIPEGLAVAGPVYAATGSKRTAVFWAGISGMAEILGGVLAWLILGSLVSPVVMAAIMAAVAGIMVALSVDELMPLAKIDPNNNPSYGVLCGMSVMGMSWFCCKRQVLAKINASVLYGGFILFKNNSIPVIIEDA